MLNNSQIFDNKVITVVVPVYKGQDFLEELFDRIQKVFEKLYLSFELILINDASPDKSWQIIENLCLKNQNIIGINLSKNFGQHAAITAGLSEGNGDIIIVMDCDLQDVPEEIPKLLDKLNEGFDLVLAKRIHRNDTYIKKIFSNLFYKILSYLTDIRMDHTIANFGAYRKKVVLSVLSMGDYIRYLPTMVNWVGFKSTSILVNHKPRIKGKSSYSFGMLINLGLNVILTFSNKPLYLTIKFGLIISVISFFLAIYYVILYFLGKIVLLGYTSLIISLWFIGGMVITVLGMLGIYANPKLEKSRLLIAGLMQSLRQGTSQTHGLLSPSPI